MDVFYKKNYIIIGVVALILLASIWVIFKKAKVVEGPVVTVATPKLEMGISGTIEEINAEGLMLTYPYPPSKLQKTVLFSVRFLPKTEFFKLDKSKTEKGQPINRSSLKSGQIVYINYIIQEDISGQLLARKVYTISNIPSIKE